MRHTIANTWIVTTLTAVALVGGATAIDTVETIDGERYEGIKVLKVEAEGVIVKHTRGIAKIPFYELDDATRAEFGFTGEAEPPIRHQKAPESGLLADIEGTEVAPADLDLDRDVDLDVDVDQSEAQEPEPAVSATDPAGTTTTDVEQAVTQQVQQQHARRVVKQRSKARVAVSASAVGASAIGTGAVRDNSVGACAIGASAAPVFARGATGRYLLGLPMHDQYTTKFTPYGNYTYQGSSGHWYGFYGRVVDNRSTFERRDFRRWRGQR